MNISRRQFIGGAAAIASSVAIGDKALALSAPSKALAAGNPLRIPVEIPGGNLAVGGTSAAVFAGDETNVLSINAAYPCPTIRLKKGDTFSANIINNLSEDVVLHWHGLHVPAMMDGHPMQAIHSGASTQITYPIINRAGTYFYHSHTDMMTASQVYGGLVGMYIIDDDEDAALPLPRGAFDVPLMITDKRYDANNQQIYAPTEMDMMRGWLGDKILVNGTADPYLEVAPTLYRFRIVNASNARIYQLALSDNSEFTIICSDGGLLETPIKTNSCFLSNSERIDVLIDFSKFTAGSSIKFISTQFNTQDSPPDPPIPAQGAALDIIRFDITKTGDSKASIPTTLSTIVKYKEEDAANTVTFALQNDAINSKMFAMERIDNTIPFDTLQIWNFVNLTTRIHPMHVHTTQYQVLDRNGSPSTRPSDQGWKDTVMVEPLDHVRVLVKFNTYSGIYLVHCHNLEHEDHGMMSNFLVSDAGSVAENLQNELSLQPIPNPAVTATTIAISQSDLGKTVKIFDSAGKMVLSKLISESGAQLTLDLHSLAVGAYHIELGNRHGVLRIVR